MYIQDNSEKQDALEKAKREKRAAETELERVSGLYYGLTVL